MIPIDVIDADITTLSVDAIVNAANGGLLGGGGVDGAIHDAAGPELIAESRTLAPCPTGGARITKVYPLPARHVIHTVGPIWHGGGRGEPQQLAACYRNCLSVAVQHGIRSIAFPSISTGAYDYPLMAAASVAAEVTVRFLRANDAALDRVTFCCFGRAAHQAYAAAVLVAEGR
jgi:O-acetyl-ADP-ribose deacetylase (regulator of RNase III)